MSFIEGIYIPRHQVERVTSRVRRETVAGVIIASFAYKGMASSGSDIEAAVRLTSLNNPGIPELLENDRVFWNEEIWPIELLRRSSLSTSYLGTQTGNDFFKMAEELSRNPGILENDRGFTPHPKRDNLPIISVRGATVSYVLDGNHRTILAATKNIKSMRCLTAYRKPAFFN